MSRSYKKTGAYSYASAHGDKWCRSYYHRSERRKTKNLLKQVSYADTYLSTDDVAIGLGYVFDCDMCMVCKDCDEECFVDYDKVSEYMDEDWYFEPNYCFNRNGCGKWIPENNPIDKVITRGRDFSLKMADKWSWASDGGAYWREDLSELRKEFEEGVFGSVQKNPFYRFPNRDIWEAYEHNRNAKHNNKPTEMVIRFSGKTLKKKLILLGYDMSTYEEWVKTVIVPYTKDHKFDTKLIPEGTYKIDIYKHRNWEAHHFQRPKWDIVDFAIDNAPLDFKTSDQLIAWLREHEEELVRKMFKRRFGK